MQTVLFSAHEGPCSFVFSQAHKKLWVHSQMVLMYSNPVLCALLAWLIRGERLGLVGCSGIAVTVAGVVLVSEPPFLFGGAQWSHTRSVGANPCI